MSRKDGRLIPMSSFDIVRELCSLVGDNMFVSNLLFCLSHVYKKIDYKQEMGGGSLSIHSHHSALSVHGRSSCSVT